MIAFLRRHPNAVAYALAVLAMAAALVGVQREASARRQDLCHTVNDQQAVLADLIEVAIDNPNGGFSLTDLPAFPTLDPATQQWVRELDALISADRPNNSADRLRAFAQERLVPADCSQGP